MGHAWATSHDDAGSCTVNRGQRRERSGICGTRRGPAAHSDHGQRRQHVRQPTASEAVSTARRDKRFGIVRQMDKSDLSLTSLEPLHRRQARDDHGGRDS
jgi:hypothetical protein